MTLSLVAAVASNRVIGNRGALPWRLSDDLAYVRKLTLNQAVIMGRKTLQSIGRPLDRRRNIVLTRDPDFRMAGCLTARTSEEAMSLANPLGAFVLGGAAIYEAFLPRAELLYITWVDVEAEGDTLFPVVRWEEWELTSEVAAPPGPSPDLPHRFAVYRRRKPWKEEDAGS